jgi:hypothetical protein
MYQVSAVPGARLLYSGKIGAMERKVRKGWTIGTAIVLPDPDSTPRGAGETGELRPLTLSYMVGAVESWTVNVYIYRSLTEISRTSSSMPPM